MGASENIIAGILVILFFLGLVIVLNRTTTDYIVSDYEITKHAYLSDLYSQNFNTVLKITHNETKRSYAQLLSNAIYYRKEILSFNNHSVNVTELFKEILDELYGENNYFMEIKPKIIDVSLNFVIDGSNSLMIEREKIAELLPTIVERVQEKINETGDEIVTADVFILGDKTKTSLCASFSEGAYYHINPYPCSIIDANDLYVQGSYDLDSDKFTIEDIDSLKNIYNLTPPYNNESEINSYREGGITDYFGSDWGTGSAYVSLLRMDSAKLIIIFPMSDELSTSSINEDCFNIPMNNFQKRAEQKICDICKISCSNEDSLTKLRSLKTIEKAVNVAKENNHIINPIFAYDCDYDFKTIFNEQYKMIYGVETSHACNEPNCQGCSLEGEGVCFHPECKESIIEQMEYMASETNGRLIDLVGIENLDYDIDNTIKSNIEEYVFRVGEFKNSSRYVISRTIPLPNKMTVNVNFYAFPDNILLY
jgi:hypothetical protein